MVGGNNVLVYIIGNQTSVNFHKMYPDKRENVHSIELCLPKGFLDLCLESKPGGKPIYLHGHSKSTPSSVNTSSQYCKGSSFRDDGDITFESIPRTSPCTISLESMAEHTEMLCIKLDGLRLELDSNKLKCFISDVYQTDLLAGDSDIIYQSTIPSESKDIYSESNINDTSSGNSILSENVSPVDINTEPIPLSGKDEINSLVSSKETGTKQHNFSDTKNIAVKRKRGRPKKVQSLSFELISTQPIKEREPSSSPLLTDGKRYNLRGVKLKKELLEAERSASDDESNAVQTEEGENRTPNSHDIILNLGTITVGDTSSVSLNDAGVLESTLNAFMENKTVETNDKCSGINESKFVSPKLRRKRNNVKVASCKICKKLFCDFTGVEEHVRKFHSSNKMYKDYIEELQGLKIVKCMQCDISFKHRYALQLHEDIVHCKFAGSSCGICKKKYKSLKSLKLHLKFVHNRADKEHLCHLCPAKFKWSNTLRQHIQEIHLEQKNCVCNICEKAFSRQGQLNRHMRIHGEQGAKKFLCTFCGKGFWYDANLHRHIKSVHDLRTEKFHCSYCGKGFAQKSSMISHVRLIHFKLYPFSCKICNSSFARSKYMEEHMRTVHEDNTYKTSDPHRQRYKYNRTADDLFYCTYCSSSFFYKAKMVEHIHSAHSKDFPFVCTVCEQGFLLQAYLTKHLVAAHGHVQIISEQETTDKDLRLLDNSEIDPTGKLSDKFDRLVDVSIQRDPEVPVECVIQDQVAIGEEFEFTDSDAAEAASLLVQVASGNLGTHYVFKNSEPVDLSDSMAGAIGTEVPESIVEIITSDQGETQIVLPNSMQGLDADCDGNPVDCAHVLPEFVEDTVVLTDNLQFHDSIMGDMPLNVVVIESNP